MRPTIFFKIFFIVVFTFTASHLALAQSSAYPNRPIKIINPLPPGGAVDAMARMLAPQLQEIFGQPIVIENKTGAGGTIGANFVAKAPADGYTILIVYDTFAVNPHVYKNLPFDTFNDLIPITELVKIPLVLVSTTKLPANNLKELVALSKIKPNGVNYSSGGAGSSGHLAAELISKSLGLRSTHIPYKGGGPALTAAISGEVDFTILGVVITAPQIKGNNLKPLSILGKKRTPALPSPSTPRQRSSGPAPECHRAVGSPERRSKPRGDAALPAKTSRNASPKTRHSPPTGVTGPMKGHAPSPFPQATATSALNSLVTRMGF